ncbi:MAG TPA: class I SAM-dependent methyltransferase [Thermoanaerobaculia bacterium]|nr:class I SAM-dependent methyltransferase [Thermoanaerobaculia bacterium]
MKYAGELPRSRYPWKEIPGSSHAVLLARIATLGEGLSVLDVGFGAGHLARRIRPRCRYLAGIELDPEAAREGSTFFDDPVLDDVVRGLAGPWREPFDVVVAADILEHLPEPGQALDLLRPLLREGGLLLVSLPNVANVTVRLALLCGRFPRTERGILDRTHLRFFTRRSGRELLEAHGFRVARETPTAMPVELALPLLGRPPLGPSVRAGAALFARVWPGMFGYQFVYEARPV